jgi:hypothetical protein
MMVFLHDQSKWQKCWNISAHPLRLAYLQAWILLFSVLTDHGQLAFFSTDKLFAFTRFSSQGVDELLSLTYQKCLNFIKIWMYLPTRLSKF